MPVTNIVKYIGSKCRMMTHLQQIFDEIPHRCFVDVFGGSGTVTLNKKPSPVEVLNDINGNLHTLYRVLLDSTLSEQLYKKLDATLYCRDDWSYAKEVCYGGIQTDDVERARCVFLLYNCSFSGNGTSYGFSKWKSEPLNSMLSKISKLPTFHERLKKVHIEHSDFSELFRRYDSARTLFYLDPPYHPSTCKKRLYRNEMNDADHERLLHCILDCDGACVLSGYDNVIYNEILNGLEKRSFTTTTIINKKNDNGQKRTECVWIKRR